MKLRCLNYSTKVELHTSLLALKKFEIFFREKGPSYLAVGVGFDAIDLNLCDNFRVPVFYTPEAPQAVVDQAIASITLAKNWKPISII